MTLNYQNTSFNPLKLILHIPVPWVFVLTYLIGVGFQLLFPLTLFATETMFVVKILGAVLFAIGAFFAGWSLIIFGKARTTTTPGEQSKKLITEGPYQFSRNPMYVSLTLAYLGEAGLLTQAWPVFVLPLVLAYVNWTVIPLEEKILKNDFNDDYVNYCKHVRRWL